VHILESVLKEMKEIKLLTLVTILFQTFKD
jgi:hypothetical protein